MASITNYLFFLCFLIMALSSQTVIASPLRPNMTLLQRACANTIDADFCVDSLSKTPEVAAASLKSRLSLVTAIAESGLAYAHQLLDYTSNKTATSTAVKMAYAECAELYEDTVSQLDLAVDVLKRPGGLAEDDGASDDVSYSLMVSIDGVAGCNGKLDSLKVDDHYVKDSSKHVEVYSVAADSVLTDIKLNGDGEKKN